MSSQPASPVRATRVREPAEVQFDRLLGYFSRFAIIGMGLVVAVVALQTARVIVMPVTIAVIIGLVFGPVADRLEARGMPPALSAGVVVLLFIGLIVGGLAAFAMPLSAWVARGPEIWERLQGLVAGWQQPIEAIAQLQDQLRALFGGSGALAVSVEQGGPITDAALMAPAIVTEILMFLISLYFYLATRQQIRLGVLALCATRRMRWRTAHVFADVEERVSRFLLVVTATNLAVGVLVGLLTWALGLPSPLLWGAMAFVVNYIPYIGQAVMLVVLIAVGFATHDELLWALAPAFGYGIINFIDGNMVTPAVIGRGVSLNPFLVFLSVTFWMWVWGPFGALVSVPILVIVSSFFGHVMPMQQLAPSKPVRRRANMTERELILANAAAAIREKAERVRAEAEEAARVLEAAKPPARETVPARTPRRAPRKRAVSAEGS